MIDLLNHLRRERAIDEQIVATLDNPTASDAPALTIERMRAAKRKLEESMYVPVELI